MSHWYDSTGKLVAQVPNASKPGELRDTTIRDARKLGLKPSVTTVQGILDKPMLNDLKVEQAIIAALNHVRDWSPSDILINQDIGNIKDSAEQHTRFAADFGTAVHSLISDHFSGKVLSATSPLGFQAMDIAVAAVEWMGQVGIVCERSEFTFVNEWAGTIDLLGRWHGIPIIADFKTREDLDKTVNWYDEQPLQLSGYALGIEEPERARVSILIDRNKKGLVVHKEWPKKEKWDRQWMKLWEYWKESKEWVA